MTAEEVILKLLQERDVGKSICPSEAARAIDPTNLKGQMFTVREAGKRLFDTGQILVTRKGKPVDPHTVKGVIRYRLA